MTSTNCHLRESDPCRGHGRSSGRGALATNPTMRQIHTAHSHRGPPWPHQRRSLFQVLWLPARWRAKLLKMLHCNEGASCHWKSRTPEAVQALSSCLLGPLFEEVISLVVNNLNKNHHEASVNTQNLLMITLDSTLRQGRQRLENLQLQSSKQPPRHAQQYVAAIVSLCNSFCRATSIPSSSMSRTSTCKKAFHVFSNLQKPDRSELLIMNFGISRASFFWKLQRKNTPGLEGENHIAYMQHMHHTLRPSWCCLHSRWQPLHLIVSRVKCRVQRACIADHSESLTNRTKVEAYFKQMNAFHIASQRASQSILSLRVFCTRWWHLWICCPSWRRRTTVSTTAMLHASSKCNRKCQSRSWSSNHASERKREYKALGFNLKKSWYLTEPMQFEKKMAKGLRLESVHIPEHINVSIVSRNSLKKHTRSIWSEALVHSPRGRRPKGSRWHSSRRLSQMDTLCCATAFRPNTAQNKLQSRPETLDVSVFPATIVVNLSVCSLLICFEKHMRITTAFAGPA